jgi:hypothetical protein
MAAYAADQKSVTSSVGSGDVIIRWVSRIPGEAGLARYGARYPSPIVGGQAYREWTREPSVKRRP